MGAVVVLDEAGWAADEVRHTLENRDLTVIQACDPSEAARAVKKSPSLLVLNLCIQPSADFAPLERLAREADGVPLVVLAGCGPLEAAARVLFPRAADVLRLPLAPGSLEKRLLGALEPPTSAGVIPSLGAIVGRSPVMQEVYQKILRAARSDATVLVTGETGSGKGLVARAIHQLSDRRDAPFVVVNCAELTESLVESELFGHVRGSFTGATRTRPGLFEAADGGTVLLDEVAEASPTVQARLLRAVEDKEIRRVGDVGTRRFDARLIVTTHVDLEARVDSGRFREDLYFRLRILRLALPPLRERRSDIPLLAKRYLTSQENGDGSLHCSPLAVEILQSHPWPGNVRELFAVLESAATTARGGAIKASDLPAEIKEAWTRSLEGTSREAAIRAALQEAGGHRGRAAEILGISRTTLWRRMGELGIDG